MQTDYIRVMSLSTLPLSWFIPMNYEKAGEINILQIKSCDNLADLFTKSLPTSVFQKLVHEIGMQRLQDLPESGGDIS